MFVADGCLCPPRNEKTAPKDLEKQRPSFPY